MPICSPGAYHSFKLFIIVLNVSLSLFMVPTLFPIKPVGISVMSSYTFGKSVVFVTLY